MALQIGDDAPDFTLLSDQNTPITLHSLRGKIDKQGKIRAIWRKVKIYAHIKQVLHETSQS